MPMRSLIVLVLLCLLAIGQVDAQATPALVSLDTDNNSLQTGQEYEIRLRLRFPPPEVSSAHFEISYDPNTFFVPGSISGLPPFQPGDFFGPQVSVTENRTAQQRQLLYTVALPDEQIIDPIGGVIASFKIIPLRPGTGRIAINNVALYHRIPNTRTGNGTIEEPQSVDYTSSYLDVLVTGDAVQPPPEPSATPLPTATFTPVPTALPSITPTPIPETGGIRAVTSALAGGFILVGLTGLIVVAGVLLRSRRQVKK
jgi:hypothetical protein